MRKFEKNPNLVNLNNGLHKILNAHGRGFHSAVIRKIKGLEGKIPWRFLAADFPVLVNGQDVKIDIILKHKEAEMFILAGCEKASPSRPDWAFVNLPVSNEDFGPDHIYVERIKVRDYGHFPVVAEGEAIAESDDIYRLGFELDRENETEPGRKRGAIEEASARICRGLNGLIEEFKRNGKYVLGDNSDSAVFIPVVFTSANLFACKPDIEKANLDSGEISRESIQLAPKPWLWFQYHLSPGIKHTAPAWSVQKNLVEILFKSYTRSIAVVGTSGVYDFLRTDWPVFRQKSPPVE